jgi:hypothetical protein
MWLRSSFSGLGASAASGLSELGGAPAVAAGRRSKFGDDGEGLQRLGRLLEALVETEVVVSGDPWVRVVRELLAPAGSGGGAAATVRR